MSHILNNERENLRIEYSFILLQYLDEILMDSSFWFSLNKACCIMDPISPTLGFLESNTSKMADVYALLVLVGHAMKHSYLDENGKSSCYHETSAQLNWD